MSVFFDFSEVYKNEYKKRIAGASFYKFLDGEGVDLDCFIKEMVVLENTFFVACSSLERRLLKDINFDFYKNFFIRPRGQIYQFVGDFIISKGGESFYKVKDIYINDSKEIKKYEKEFSFQVKIKNDYKKAVSDTRIVKSIINDTINVYDYHCLDFVKDFDGYLEFEKKHFLRKLGFYKTLSFKAVELKEIKRNINICKKYESVTYFDDGNNYIYVDGDAPVEDDFNSVLAVEFLIKIKNNEESYNNLQVFVSQEIELAREEDALENGELKSGNNELEFNFKTRRLGSLLKPLELLNENESETIYSFSKFWSDEDLELYFSFARVNDYIAKEFGDKPVLVNILSGDVALYKRGKQALRDLKEGNVKSPGIASYLFNVSEFETSEDIINRENIVWSNNSLDKYQKEAVYKALNSNSIFLLQGPPGTGKTQTITEMVYQFNKLGKKVLLSSQTHVAIDNVIERLPDELDVLPIRLINSERKIKSSRSYLPDKLVDNFYDKMKNKYLNKEENYAMYGKEVESSLKEFKKVTELVLKNIDLREEVKSLKNNRNSLKVRMNELDNKINVSLSRIRDSKSQLLFINEFKRNNYELGEYQGFLSSSIFRGLEFVKNYMDEEYNVFNDYLKYFNIYFKNNDKFKGDYRAFVNKNISTLDAYYKEVKNSLEVYKREIEDYKESRAALSKEISEIDDTILIRVKGKEKDFKYIDEYFDNYFNNIIMLNKKPVGDIECLNAVREYIEEEEKKFVKEEEKYLKYKDLYKDVIKYIEDNKDELLDSDRVKYTKYLLNNNANVYSITCNANSRYLEEKNDYLKKLGLGDIELKNIDFDVVIIDEVSKANGVELLIPILYGKSIILVGDHRQLPPLFKYKEKMFNGAVDKGLLSKYEALVENSMFKELFKKVRNNKYMLVNQYRSHEQIMDVVNIFYDDKLKLGNKKEQNEAKNHYLNVSSNSYSLFEENIHTYWFNSHYDVNRNISYEKKKKRGSVVSTSFYNEEEIYLTKEILRVLDRGYKALIDEGKIKEACSVGVISLYGDQVSELKKEVGKMRFDSLNFNKNKVSTVDEFQGKEEDIIIVNFVRNNPLFEAGEFVKKFERINVALSRARKLLIIIGSKPFFSNLKIKMEALDDNSDVRVRKIYKEIYDRVVGKIDEPNSYFGEVRYNED